MALSTTAEAISTNRDLGRAKIAGMKPGSFQEKLTNGNQAPIMLVDEPVSVYRGPLVVWFGFFITRFLGGGVGWELLCVVLPVTGGTRVRPGGCR